MIAARPACINGATDMMFNIILLQPLVSSPRLRRSITIATRAALTAKVGA
jgi:hypothetical protein